MKAKKAAEQAIALLVVSASTTGGVDTATECIATKNSATESITTMSGATNGSATKNIVTMNSATENMTANSNANESIAMENFATNSNTTDNVATMKNATQSIATKNNATESIATESIATESSAMKSNSTKSSAKESIVTENIVTNSSTTDSIATVNNATESIVTGSIATESMAVRSSATENIASKTSATDNIATESIAKESIVTAGSSEPPIRKRSYLHKEESDSFDEPPAKKFKIDDQKLCDQTTSDLVNVAVVPIDYPDRKLDADEVALIMKVIKLRILGLASDRKAPTFKSTVEREGAIVFSCTSEKTAEWLRSCTSEIIIKDGLQVHTLPADKLFKRHRIVVHVDDPKMSVKEILEFLDRQNKDLAANEWIIVRGNKSKGAVSFHFSALVGRRSLEALMDVNFKPFCGLSQARVELLGKERMEENPSSG